MLDRLVIFEKGNAELRNLKEIGGSNFLDRVGLFEKGNAKLRNQKEMADCNNSLSIWNSLYGDFNEAGLRAHPKIKLRERRPATMQFNMNY